MNTFQRLVVQTSDGGIWGLTTSKYTTRIHLALVCAFDSPVPRGIAMLGAARDGKILQMEKENSG